MAKAASIVPQLDVLKLRFNFGKSLFYTDYSMEKGVPVDTAYNLSQLKVNTTVEKPTAALLTEASELSSLDPDHAVCACG
ncbi:MAG: hypothetical protein WDW38_010295 [Sanguina aurantia]